tara:strand:- start:3345 stop:3734 length:390 start_codon:yes stop_codon:yes gene_type:complete
MQKKYFDQVIEVVYPNAQAAGTYQVSANLSAQYDNVEGARIIELGSGGDASQYEVGVSFSAEDINILPTNKIDWQFTTATPMGERNKTISAEAKGNQVLISTKLRAAASAELRYQIIFRLSKCCGSKDA